jgi:epoxyqueuosine reductase
MSKAATDEAGAGKGVLLHSCCAPCAAPSAERLVKEGFAPTLYYDNPNIAPEEEWRRRLDSMRTLADAFDLPLIVVPYDHESWLSLVRGLEDEPEGGSRCSRCFFRVIESTARRAGEEGLPYFTTTLTLSPLKDAQRIFQMGAGCPGFLERDFKKKNGVQRSVELSRRLGLYRQDYCGCEFGRVK